MSSESNAINRSDNVIVFLMLFTAFSLFIFNEPVRALLNQSNLNLSYNIIFMVSGTLTIVALLLKGCVDIRVALATLTFAGIALISIVTSGHNLLGQSLKVIFSMILPFLITGFKLPGQVFTAFLVRFIKTFNVVCFILIGAGILDYLSGAAIQLFFVQHHLYDSDFINLVLLERASGIYRYYSFLGHPLTNAGYILIFYTLNILYNRYFNRLINEYLLTLASLLGLILCGSRTALIIGLLMFVFLNNRKSKAAFWGLLSPVCAGVALTPMFQNNLLKRFYVDTATGSAGGISGGRNRALCYIFSGNVQPPSIFTGGGTGYSRQVTLSMGGFIKSFEYPFLMFPYDWGVLGTIIIYTLILLLPSYICIKNKCYFLLMPYLAIVLYMNGQNDIANYSDYMGQLSFLTMVAVNLAYAVKRNREREQN